MREGDRGRDMEGEGKRGERQRGRGKREGERERWMREGREGGRGKDKKRGG